MAQKKVGFIVRHSIDEPETATLPFMLATGALTMDCEPVIVLQGEGVRLGFGEAANVHAEGLPPLADLLEAVVGAGHRIMVCSPCMTMRGYSEDDLLDGFFIGGAAKVIEAMLECENFLSY